MNTLGSMTGSDSSARCASSMNSLSSVTSICDLAVSAAAKIGASLVGTSWCARRTAASVGDFVMTGGIRRNVVQACPSSGNFVGRLRSASATTSGEMTMVSFPARPSVRTVPEAPWVELRPARSALVSTNTRHIFGIQFSPTILTSLFGRARDRCFWIWQRAANRFL